jgi:hypothetical protein
MESAHVPTLYLLFGKIAAGKSTLARRLAARPATLLISEDHWVSNLFSGDLRTTDDYALIRRGFALPWGRTLSIFYSKASLSS